MILAYRPPPRPLTQIAEGKAILLPKDMSSSAESQSFILVPNANPLILCPVLARSDPLPCAAPAVLHPAVRVCVRVRCGQGLQAQS